MRLLDHREGAKVDQTRNDRLRPKQSKEARSVGAAGAVLCPRE
jgi:hypothetical protein